MAKHTCNQKERRNERERKRVNQVLSHSLALSIKSFRFQVNQGFNQLRARIERVSLKKKLSKADTLREATRYIAHLKQLLNNESAPRKTVISLISYASEAMYSVLIFQFPVHGLS